MAEKIDRLREERQGILLREAERDARRQRIEEMKAFLQEQPDTPPGYDEQLVRRLIEKVTVHEDRVMVEFKSGLERLASCGLGTGCRVLFCFAESCHCQPEGL